MSVYGYARVSSRDQNEERQLLMLRAFPVADGNIFTDKLSGKDFNRPQYRKLLRKLGAADVLVIPAIDRLGRNYEEIMEQWRIITKEKRADIVVLDMPLLDTRSRGRDLTGTFIADLVLQILSYVAETERVNIKKRQEQGIAAAKKRGVRFGAPPKPIPDAYYPLAKRVARRELSINAAARELGVSPHTFARWQER